MPWYAGVGTKTGELRRWDEQSDDVVVGGGVEEAQTQLRSDNEGDQENPENRRKKEREGNVVEYE